MSPNPFLGVFFHWLGGLASGSFYVPYRFVRKWSWETYWLTGGVFSWIIAPWVLGLFLTRDLPAVIGEAPGSTLFWTYFFGVLWGLGGLTFGLTMRYLGMSLGMAVALGYTAAFGTLMPPIFKGEFFSAVLPTTSGQIILFGVLVCMAGIAVAGMAGMSKERELSEEAKRASIKEFDFKKGILVATFSGVMSACFSYGLAAGDPIKEISLKHAFLQAAREDGLQVHDPGTEGLGKDLPAPFNSEDVQRMREGFKDPGLRQLIVDIFEAGGDPLRYQARYGLWQGLPVLVVLLLGGFTTNFLWCLILHVRNGTGYQYLSSESRPAPSREQETIIETTIDAPGEEVAERAPGTDHDGTPGPVPLLWNYVFCALAGTTWYFQFFFYTMGETQMGRFKFSSWTLHMASIMIFSTLWGIFLKEWNGTSRHTKKLVALTLLVLIASTVIIGYGNSLATESAR